MKLKKLLLTFSFLFISLISFSQQIGSGFATGVSDFNIELPSGFYQGLNATGQIDGGGWNHLLNLRHSSPENNHQLQIASSYFENDRLFFRKFARTTGTSNPDWHEVATREGNAFNGNQTVNGNLFILNSTNKIVGYGDSTNYFIGTYNVSGSSGLDLHWHGGIRFGDATSNSVMQITNGSVGIGTTTPDEKLTVKGKIHAQEVRVDLQGACTPDYVFQKYYTGKSELKSDYVMPTLAEIENFTKKNHHLPNVPSGQEVQKKGVSLGEMSNVLLQKVEELTLYAIEQQKKLDEQNKTIAVLASRLERLEKK